MTSVFQRERRHYPVLAHYAYLDTGTTGAIPLYAYDAMNRYLQQRVDDAMDIDFYHEQWDFAEDVRGQIAQMIHAQSGDCIAFGQNSSALFNLFCTGIGLGKGDNVVIYTTAYPAMVAQWMYLKETVGIEVRVAQADNGTVSVESLLALCDERTKAITVCHVDSGTGYRHDLQALGAFCRKHDIWLGVDATQSCGAMAIDVQAMQVDFMTTSCYKWLQSIQGIGFAYCAPRLLKKIKPADIGWASMKNRVNGDAFALELSETASRLESGGLPAPGLYGLYTVLETYQRLGAQAIEDEILSTVAYLYQRVQEVDDVQIAFPQPMEHRSNLVSLQLPAHISLCEKQLRAGAVRAKCLGGNRLRIAIHYYNDKHDIDRLIDFLKTFV